MHEKMSVKPLLSTGGFHSAGDIEQTCSCVPSCRRTNFRRLIPGGLLVAALLFQTNPSFAQSVEDLRDLSIEELANIQISSVSKSVEPLGDAPAAIFVITHDAIIRSGANSIPEMLRLAPNLEVAQLNATSYAISARGFNVGDNASLSNKLLVLIDGRSIYTPLFGGVYWDMQEALPENIERIEVISGPGATLYGANAVNGVINIITRNSAETPGGLLTLGGGNLERSASLQYGGRITQDLTYRVHAEGFEYTPYKLPGGKNANDGWSKPQGGFRLDWTPPGDTVTLQGDLFTVAEDPNGFLKGQDLSLSWQHALDGGASLQVQGYYDKEARYIDNGGGGFSLTTYDLSVQHSFSLGGWNSMVWGIGERSFSYNFLNTALQLVPPQRTLNLANIFGQDTIALNDRLKMTLGLKLEDEPYTGVAIMPSARLSWKITDDTLLWGAISRAVRAPTPIDEDLREYGGSVDFLNGSSQFRPEVLTAYETGIRVQVSPNATLSVSTFYNIYDDLRTIELSPTSGFLPLQFGNLLRGTVYGLEAWGNYRLTEWWRLSAGLNVQRERFHYLPGSSAIAGLAFTADDPNMQASLRSSMNLGEGVTWEADLRYTGRLPHPVVAAYAELNMRLNWKVSPSLELSLSGSNLLHPRHREFLEDGQTDEIPRSFFVEARWRF